MRTAHTHTRVCRAPCHSYVTHACTQSAGTHAHRGRAAHAHGAHARATHTVNRKTRLRGRRFLERMWIEAPPGPDAPSPGTRRPPLAVTWPPRPHGGRTAGLHPSAGQGPGQATSALVTADPTGTLRRASWYRVTCHPMCPSRQGPPALPRARDGKWGCRARQTPPASAAYRWEREEGDGEDGEAGGDGLPDPGLRHLVPVADGGDRDLSGRDGGQQSRFQGLWTGVCPARPHHLPPGRGPVSRTARTLDSAPVWPSAPGLAHGTAEGLGLSGVDRGPLVAMQARRVPPPLAEGQAWPPGPSQRRLPPGAPASLSTGPQGGGHPRQRAGRGRRHFPVPPGTTCSVWPNSPEHQAQRSPSRGEPSGRGLW